MKFALKELRGNIRFAVIFSINLSLGLIGFTSVDAFKDSFEASMASGSRAMLTADMELTARREIQNQEIELAVKSMGSAAIGHTEQRTLYSMVASSQKTKLAEIKVIDNGYPFYGNLSLRRQGVITSEAVKDILGDEPAAWVYPEVLVQLGLAEGDRIKIGEIEFRISDVVMADNGVNWIGASVAPRIYIGKNHLPATDLVKFGSTLWHSHLFKLADDVDSDVLAESVGRYISDPGIRVRSHHNANDQTARLSRYLADYLGLVALSALFLANIGSAFLCRSYMRKKTKEVATLLALGASTRHAIALFTIQLIILGLVSATIAIAIVACMVPILPKILRDFVSQDMTAHLTINSVIVCVSTSVLGSLFLSIPWFMRIQSIRLSGLFAESGMSDFRLNWSDVVAHIPALLGAWLLAIWQGNSLIVGTAFFATFLACGLAIALVGWVVLQCLKVVFPKGSFSLRLALRQLSRSPLISILVLLALGLSTLIINVVPQIRKSLQTEVTMPHKSRLPSLFMFDIQDDQAENLQKVVQAHGLSLSQISPMIRAQLKRVNGKSYYQQPESSRAVGGGESRDFDQRYRGLNLSFRDGMTDAESIVVGHAFSGSFIEGSGQMAEISLEVRFADRMGLKLGDTLEFDVQGVAVSGRVVNLRKVRWTSFQPNFFVQFQPGVLESAPKTFVASVSATGQEQKSALQNEIVSKFSNVSVIDVSRVVEKISDIVDRMGLILTSMAWLTLAAGLVVLYSIAEYQARLREKDIALLKILGGSFAQIQGSMLVEFGIVALISSFLGGALAIICSLALSTVIFDGVWVFDWRIPVLSTVGVTGLAIGAAQLATSRVLRQKPNLFLQEAK